MQTDSESSGNAERPVRGDGGWAFQVAKVAGIPIRIHFTFLFILLYVALMSYRTPGDVARSLLLVIGIFTCVVLHELGHALVAKRFGVQTRDITLYPIGGVAMLQGRLPKPKEEFWIALAGPMVNVVIAVILGAWLFLSRHGLPKVSLLLESNDLLANLFVANVILPLFNMIPAFPMDGGRVLRAVLAMNMSEARATKIAGSIGQLLAIMLGFFGIMTGSLVLIIIAFFVYLGAGQEVSATVGRSMVSGHKMAEAMQTQFITIASGLTLEAASKLLLEGAQQDFPVVLGDEVLGILTRDALIRGFAAEGPSGYVSGHMIRDFKSATPDLPLESALDAFYQGDTSPILVLDDGRLVGMVTRENFGEFLMLQHVRRVGSPKSN